MIELHYWIAPNGHKITIFPPTVTEVSKQVLFGQTAANGAPQDNGL